MHWIARATLVISILFTGVMSFQIFITVDEAQPAGTRTSFTVEQIDSPNKKTAIQAISTSAKRAHVNILKVQAGTTDSLQSRTLFVFAGDKHAYSDLDGYTYPTFSNQSLTTSVAPATRITTEDLRGVYVSSADHTQLATILADLRQAGITASDTTTTGLEIFVYALGPGNLGAAFVVVYVALALAIAYSQITNRKVHAVKSLHGYSRAPILGAELASAAATFGIGTAALVMGGCVYLWSYNGFAQIWRFAHVVSIAMGILAVFITVLITLLGGAATLRHRVPEILKGERVPFVDGALAAVTQVIVLAVVLGSVSGAIGRIEAVSRTQRELDRWTRMTPAYVLRLSTAGQHDDNVRDAPALAAIIARMDRQGKVLMAGYKGGQLANGGSETQPGEPEGSNAMIVNPKYLAIQPVLDEQSHRIEHTKLGKNNFTLLVPVNYHGDPQALLKSYSEYFSSFACRTDTQTKNSPCAPHGTVIRTSPGQDLFTFKGTDFGPSELQEKTSLTDPVLAVVAPDSGLISPMEYLSYTSLDAVLFLDSNELDRQLTMAGIRGSFQGIDNAADAVTDTVVSSRIEQRMDVFGISLGTVVLVLATMVSAAVYCDRRRRTSFVQLTHGYRFATRHGALVATDLVLALLTAAVTLAVGHMHRPRDLAAAVILVAAQVSVATICVRVYEARAQADFVKRP